MLFAGFKSFHIFAAGLTPSNAQSMYLFMTIFSGICRFNTLNLRNSGYFLEREREGERERERETLITYSLI